MATDKYLVFYLKKIILAIFKSIVVPFGLEWIFPYKRISYYFSKL